MKNPTNHASAYETMIPPIHLNRMKRRCLIIIVILLVPFVLFNAMITPDRNEENFLRNALAEIKVKLENLQARYVDSMGDMHVLSRQLLTLVDNAHVPPDLHGLINNGTSNITSIKLPSIYHFVPHLLDDPNSLRPAFLQSKGRSAVNMVLGIPTVKRQVQTYLMPTLKNLLESMDNDEKMETLIIVMVAETDLDYVNYIAKQIEVRFPKDCENGLIDVISPSPSYYPNLTKLPDTLGDDHDRVVWRSKQNFDFAFLMSYAQPKGNFYVQLEDDIVAKKNFITTMKNFALQKISENDNWFVLDFCQLGFIGKLFKCVQLPSLIHYILMFHNDKPVDWLLDTMMTTKVCRLDKDTKHCKAARAELWLHYKPSLFQHVGTHSSLKGKVQKLKDKQFGKIPEFYGHKNPEAKVETRMKPYKQHTLQRAYAGQTFFWGLLPQPGDHLKFEFTKPIFIKKYLFKSGNAEHPLDIFFNTTIEVMPESSQFVNRNNPNVTEDGYIIVGQFDGLGMAQGTIDRQLGRVKALRMTVHSESENWAILSEIHIIQGDES